MISNSFNNVSTLSALHQYVGTVDAQVNRPYYFSVQPSQPSIRPETNTSSVFQPSINDIQAITWNNSSVPFKPSIIKNLNDFEANYGIDSEVMYEGYLNNTVSQYRISYDDLNNWINDYLVYS